MNAIIGLCHFCEAHGPRPLFCTFTTDNVRHTVEPSPSAAQCSGCTSLGSETVIVTKDADGTIYCSRESVPNADVTAFLRQAAIRSITCEVSWNKEGGVVYFGDARGHILSLTFQLKDTRARGLKRWFSIVILMKDKMLLLNITPVLSEHMQKIAKELQEFAEKIFDDEQKICSQRALRLNTGRNDFGPARSLTQLTGNDDIFKKVHSQFTCMLKAGALTYTETLYTSQDLLKKLDSNILAGSIFEANACSVASQNNCMSLRAVEKLLGNCVFRVIMYCTLTGINIIVNSNSSEQIISGLLRLLPVNGPNVPNISCNNYTESIQSSASVCVLEETDNRTYCYKWPGTLPVKCPTLMIRIENAMCNQSLNDDVLHQHVKSLQLEWLGTARTLKSAMASSKSTEPITKLKQVLGITAQDELLLNYWNETFCT